MATPPIVITGATGGLGGRVASRLASAGVPTRLLVRDPQRAPRFEGAEIVVGDYADPASITHAVAGADTLFLVSGPEARARVPLHAGAIEAAVAGGIRRIVYTSFLAASHDATFTFARDHAATEDVLAASGLAWTSLRNSLYQDVVPYFVGEDGVIRGPAGDGRVSFVARDDIADVATAVLRVAGEDDAGRTLDVTGPAAWSFAEAAAALTEVTGREIRYHAETLEEARSSRAPSGAPDWEIEGWVTSYSAATTGELATVSDVVGRFAGHPPVALDAWLRANPDAWAHLRP